MMITMRRLKILMAGLALAASALPAHATLVSFSNEFSGSGYTCANVTCATLSIDQVGSNVSFVLTANLASGEFITGLYGNRDPFFGSSIGIGTIGGTYTGGFTFVNAVDGFKADGDGFFDWTFAFA